MNATITLSNTEIETAVKEYLARSGWTAERIHLTAEKISGDYGQGTTTNVTATASVTPKAPETWVNH